MQDVNLGASGSGLKVTKKPSKPATRRKKKRTGTAGSSKKTGSKATGSDKAKEILLASEFRIGVGHDLDGRGDEPRCDQVGASELPGVPDRPTKQTAQDVATSLV